MSQKPGLDPRVRRSRKWLQDALRRLVQERAYESITVQEIAACADVNRTTFYQHFHDKDDLLESIVADLLDQLFAEAAPSRIAAIAANPTEAPPYLRRVFEAVGREAKFYRRMLGQEGSPIFVRRMVTALEAHTMAQITLPEFNAVFPAGPHEMPPSLLARFLALGVVGSLTWWLESGTDYTARQAADWSWRLVFRLGDWEALVSSRHDRAWLDPPP